MFRRAANNSPGARISPSGGAQRKGHVVRIYQRDSLQIDWHVRLGLAVVVWLVIVATLWASQGTRRDLPPLSIESLGGTESYGFYCASCHGRGGTGDGPVAAALRVRPADLTTLAERNGGEFPRERVMAYITGRGRQIDAHGGSDMPIWGPAFKALDASDARAQARMAGIVGHLESLQAADNGAEIFRTSCATCHGVSGQGGGPLGAHLRRMPPDLTKYSMRNGGVFPSERVARIIDGRDVPSHGDRAMPVWGDAFRRAARDANDAAAQARIRALVRFLQSIQERPAE
jgi:mono/diheme cytochrome c family protein